MSTTSQTIVSHLERKEALAAALARDSELGERVRQLQEWQARRLATTYEDLLAESTYSAALRFFLTDLYGPHDFSPRNRELRRAWHSMERALPDAALHVLCDALELFFPFGTAATGHGHRPGHSVVLRRDIAQLLEQPLLRGELPNHPNGGRR